MELMKKFAIIDDSALMRRVISDIIRQGYKNALVSIAINGLDGYNLLLTKDKPDVIIMDINMPKLSGLELLAKLKDMKYDVPILVVSSVALEGAQETIQALELGALDFIAKPAANENLQRFAERLLEKIDVAFNYCKKVEAPVLVPAPQVTPKQNTGQRAILHHSKLIALCCSTGGPKALQSVIPKLKRDMDAPMLIVQHMPAGFTLSLANRLNEISEVDVKEAEEGDILEKGVVYIAKGGCHMEVLQNGRGYKLHLNTQPPREGLRPCANIMYESLCDLNFEEILCVVLTGMGADGTSGIRELSKHKKISVIAQDAASSVVYGMPKAIYDAGLVNEVVELEKIADTIMRKVGVQ